MTRIQFDIPERRLLELDKLRAECGFETRKDLFNNALALLEWSAKERRKGKIIASMNENSDTYSELMMPFFAKLSEASDAKVPAKFASVARAVVNKAASHSKVEKKDLLAL